MPDRVTLAQIDKELVRRKGLHEFVRRAWHLIEPGKFVDNWHLGVICEHLEACQRREIRKIIINVPPGCMKSLLVCVFYPAWCWILDNSEKFVYVSYADDLSQRDAKKMRDIVGSEWFIDRWGVMLPPHGMRKVKMFENVGRGFRYSTSIGGQITGKHGTQTWVDDPTKPEDTSGSADETRVMLEKAWDFWRGTLFNRQAIPAKHVHGLIMQRLHDSDLAGHLLSEQGEYVHLMLPMRHEVARACVTPLGNPDQRTDDGELLWPERFSDESVTDLETTLGPFASSQLQQNPVPSKGGIFQRAWLESYWHPNGPTKLPPLYEGSSLFSWDLSFSGKKGSSYVVGQLWLRSQGKFWLVDQWRGQWSYTETRDAILRACMTYPKVIRVLVENKANGPAVIDDLKKDIPGLEPVEPEGGKESRANAISHLFRGGAVVLPHPMHAPWVLAYQDEMVRFPKASADDQVDATSQGLLKLYTATNKLVEAMSVLKQERLAAQRPRV